MATSDSEGFESADEGHNNLDKNARKQRLSSSNYSDKTSESDAELKKPSGGTKPKDGNPIVENPEKATDGWDDFDIEDTEPILKPKDNIKPVAKKDKSEVDQDVTSKENLSIKLGKEVDKCKDTGWDDFDDWGEVEDSSSTQKIEKQSQPDKQTQQVDKDIREVTERLAAASTNTQFANQGWGWGWGVDSLLSTATAGFTTITNQVSQGISTVLESGIGAPDPEELARRAKESEAKSSDSARPDGEPSRETEEPAKKETNQASGDAAFPFGNILSGVTKFVESTGTKVIAGGLDTLETIGKKTMEVLQDGDPGLAKKRAMLGLDTADKPVLSQVLREAKAKAEEEDRIKEDRREAKEVHYENLFDDFEGLVHLEALEMLSRQVRMRIEERLRAADADKRQDLKETLQQVAELCEMPEEEEDEEDSSSLSKPDAFHERLQTATQDLGLKLQFQPLVKQYTEIVDYLSTTDTETTEKAVYKRAVSGLAQATALSVEVYHKTGEMLLVKPRRSTADEADALTQMTVVLSKHISELATLFTEKLNSIATENKDQVNTYITNIFLEAGNSSSYIQNAFQLTLPILQIGAV